MDIIAFNEASTANGRIESFIENPDSTSGIITVPKVIASGENITIPAGRVAVLPNVVVDGTLNIDGEVFIPSGATLGDLDSQIALKADTSYVNTQLVLKANTTDLKEIGVGQTWQDVTASRVTGTTYTNSTGRPILISCFNMSSAVASNAALTINGKVIANQGLTSANSYYFVSGICPDEGTYSLVASGASQKWLELR